MTVVVNNLERNWIKVVVLFVSGLNVMQVGMLRADYFCNIPLRDYQF